MAELADAPDLGSGTSGVQVRPLLPAPRRNGLRSIQKAQLKGWAFLIPLRHSSFSPRNFASQISAGAPPPGERPCGAAYRLRRLFLQKSPRAHSAAAPSPHETLLAQISAGARPPCGRPCGAAYRLRRLFCFTKSLSRAHSVAAPSPHETLLRKVSWGPRCFGGGKAQAAHRLRRLSALCSARFLTEAGGYAMLIHKSYERKA